MQLVGQLLMQFNRCGQIPKDYPFYYWNNDKGYDNLGVWVEAAAKAAGK